MVIVSIVNLSNMYKPKKALLPKGKAKEKRQNSSLPSLANAFSETPARLPNFQFLFLFTHSLSVPPKRKDEKKKITEDLLMLMRRNTRLNQTHARTLLTQTQPSAPAAVSSPSPLAYVCDYPRTHSRPCRCPRRSRRTCQGCRRGYRSWRCRPRNPLRAQEA